MAFDEEYIDPHGECAAEIHRLQSLAASRAEQIAGMEKVFEECAKAICPLCRDDIELVPIGERHYGGWHQITELGGAADGGTDYEECKAEHIRAAKAAYDATERKPTDG